MISAMPLAQALFVLLILGGIICGSIATPIFEGHGPSTPCGKCAAIVSKFYLVPASVSSVALPEVCAAAKLPASVCQTLTEAAAAGDKDKLVRSCADICPIYQAGPHNVSLSASSNTNLRAGLGSGAPCSNCGIFSAAECAGTIALCVPSCVTIVACIPCILGSAASCCNCASQYFGFDCSDCPST